MGAGETENALDAAFITRDFDRVRRGYDPAAVDHHLALVAARVQGFIEQQVHAPDESLDLVLKATRRSVDEALSDARERASAIIAEAEATAAAAQERAAEKCRALDAEGRERYAEMVRLTQAQTETLAELDAQIADRQDVLRATAGDLERLASRIVNPADPAPHRIAAMDDGAVEIVVPAQPGSGS